MGLVPARINTWLDALRGGGFIQTKNRLRDKAGFCCLGVACDLYAQEHPNSSYWEFIPADESGDAPPHYRFVITDENGKIVSSDEATLPSRVREWLGLTDTDGYHERGSLAGDNDSGQSFGDIATYIEGAFSSMQTEGYGHGLFADDHDRID